MNLEKSRKIKFLEGAFGPGNLEPSEENLHLRCPNCKEARESKKKLYVAVDTGWYNCWVCNTSGKSIGKLVRKFARDHLTRCNELYPPSFTLANDEATDIEIPVVELPERIRLVADVSQDPDTRAVYTYLKNRGMSRIDMYRWRVCVSNEFKFRRKAIFPSFDSEGKLNYYTARSIDETKFKYNNAKVPKSSIIFNEIDIDWNEPVILVEGVFDAVKCPDNSIPVLGSTLSKKSRLFTQLTSHRSTVIVAFDDDAEKKSHEVCQKLHRAGCATYQVKVTGGDLGSRTKEDVREVLRTASKWSQEDLITHKIANIRSGSIL